MGNRMKYAAFIMIMLTFLVSNHTLAQVMPLANEAARLCGERQYAKALIKSAESIASPMESADAYPWYVHGFVLKEMYKSDEAGMRKSPHRTDSERALLTALTKANASKHEQMIKLALKYLASTYYNDALQSAQVQVNGDEQEARALFAQFEHLMKVAVPETDFSLYLRELEKAFGQRYFALWERDTDRSEFRDLSAQRYEAIVRNDSSDSDAYYNLAVIHYNQAVFMYRKLGPDMDMFDSITLQEEAAKLIRTKALVNMERAYALAPEKGEVVRGIMLMHRALDHEKDVAYFKKEIERLIGEGKIKSEQRK